MTAEIAVMNKKAVALAADSAVTIGRQNGAKVYNSANKLFGLYPHSTIGIMIYGDIGLNDVPWETLIKVYRHESGGQVFDTTEEYAKHFNEFLESNALRLFEDDSQSFEVYSATSSMAASIRSKYCKIENVHEFPDDTGQITKSSVLKAIEELHAMYSKDSMIDNLQPSWMTDLEAKYLASFQSALDATLLPKILNSTEVTRLAHCVWYSLYSNAFLNRSGIVFAGFGTKEIFPHVVAHNVQRVVNNRLVYSRVGATSVAFYRDAKIIPFAQDDGVGSVVWGRSPQYEESIRGNVDTMMNELPDEIIKVLGQIPVTLDTAKMKALKDALLQTTDTLKQGLWKNVEEIQNKYFNEQILGALGILPKDELATVAEAMIQMTALRRKMSDETESVGGPIDVALISKGDGFVWVKRKHYFDSKLNPQFFARYSR